MRYIIVYVCVILGILSFANAQTVPSNSILNSNFKNGVGFSTPDSSYSLSIRFRIQNRFLMNTISESDLSPASWEARVRRCRLSFAGHVYNPSLAYYLQLSFSRSDMDWSVSDATAQNGSPNVIRDAIIFYRPSESFQFGFGQMKLPGNRQRMNSSGALQFYDRSPVNTNFTLDRDFGVFTYYTFHFGNFKTLLKGAITSGEGRNSISSNSGLAYTGRIELLPLGEFADGGDYFEGDVAREEKPKISLAGGYHFNDLAVRTQGQLGKDLYAPVSYHVYLVDFLLKYKGVALSSEFISKKAQNSAITYNAAGANRYLISGNGVNTQLSFCFKSKWEIAGRYSIVTPDKEIEKLMAKNQQIGLGITKYLMKHKVKTQFNVFYNQDDNVLTNASTKSLFAVFQVELGI